MGATAAIKLRQVGDNFATILSLELFCAAQGIDLRRRIYGSDKELGKGTREIYSAIRNRIPFIENDVYMKPHLNSAATIVDEFVKGSNA